MKTLNDIIDMVSSNTCCKDSDRYNNVGCTNCPMVRFCGVDTKLMTLDYLYRGEYYG